MKPSERREQAAGARTTGHPLLAVVDVGATSIRMAVAEVPAAGKVRTIETVQQSVELGKDTFTRGYIERETTERCVEALRSFTRVLREYGITDMRQVRAVATSAVHEATNKEAFLDRVYVGTGITIEDIDAAEANRYTYLGVKPLLDSRPSLRRGELLIVEVGGGSTEFLALQKGQVTYSHGFRLGSLRMRESLEDYRAPATQLPELLRNQIEAAMDRVRTQLRFQGKPTMITLGGDARFAAARVNPAWDEGGLFMVPIRDLRALTDETLRYSVDELVQRYDLTYPSAETLGPALLAYTWIAERLKLKGIHVSSATFRDGLLLDMTRESWRDEFARQTLQSAATLGEKFHTDMKHARNVADLSLQLFRELKDEHQLGGRYELILNAAALLHDIGLFVSDRSHHKHSMYLIQNSEVFGLGQRDLMLTSLVARYHRRNVPRSTHPEYAVLSREQRLIVSKLAAILRVADALDWTHSGRIRKLEVQVQPEQLTLSALNVPDVSLERMALQQKGPMFEMVYGMRVVLQAKSSHE